MAKNTKVIEAFFKKTNLKYFDMFFKKYCKNLQQVCKISEDFGIHFKNTKYFFYFIFFNIWNYKLIRKIYF